MNSLKEFFEKLDAKQKKYLIYIVIAGAILFIALNFTSKKEENKVQQVTQDQLKPKYIGLDADMIEKTQLREQRMETDALKQRLAGLEEALKNRSGLPVGGSPSMTEFPPAPTSPPQRIPGERSFWADNDIFNIPENVQTAEQQKQYFAQKQKAEGELVFPPPPRPDGRMGAPTSGMGMAAPAAGQGFPPASGQQGTPPPPQSLAPPAPPEIIGGIGHLSAPAVAAKPASADSDPDKKKERTVYLPPSFFPAELISGGDISTGEEGSGPPEPFFLRVQAPAILPSDVKLNLKGCFVVAEGTGRLDKERAIIRTVSLSCISRKGESIIDTPIKGYVGDADSKNGLAGPVVSRMGATMARTFLAGLFEGAGEALESGAEVQSISSLTGGVTSIVDANELGRAALGTGLSEASKGLKEFYLDLARQSGPVIEIKSARKVTIFITEGTELKIKEFQNDNIDEKPTKG